MKKQKSHLFILANPSSESARVAYKLARELNLRVSGQHGNQAIEVMANTQQAERLYKSGLFSNRTAGAISTEHLKQVDSAMLPLLRQWNRRFTAKAVKARRDKTKIGLSLADKNHSEPAPYSRFDPSDIMSLWLDQAKKKQLKTPTKSGFERFGTNSKKVSAKQYLQAQAFFKKNIKDTEMAVHVSDMYARTAQQQRFLYFNLEWLEILILILIQHQHDVSESGCRKMHGRVSVGIVIVNSAGSNGPQFNTSERDEITNEIKTGLSWLVTEHPTGDLVWVYDEQLVRINIADQMSNDTISTEFDEYWRFPAMEKVEYETHTYDGSNQGIDDYREDMLFHHGSDYAVVIFVTKFGTSWHAYSSGNRFIQLSEHGNNWGGWGQNDLNFTAAHEICHQFGAKDEYSGSGTPCSSCTDTFGCDSIPNGNCGDCASPVQPCVMRIHEPSMCNYTRGQIGWSKIFIELHTDDDWQSGTDDSVYLDIGDQTFELDIENHNDRENNHVEGYALWVNGNFERSDIKRILIRKDPDGFFGGWKLKRVRAFHDGDEICNENVNQWLEDRQTWVVACEYENTLVNKLRLRVQTADDMWAGTDDNVTLRLAGRDWDIDSDANDFERDSSRWYNLDPQTGIRVSDLNSISIEKSGDGLFGGWKLKGLRLEVNGNIVYDNNSINKWLEGNDRIFSDSI